MWLSEKVIAAVQAELAAPVVFATENDGSTRYCLDYYKLNVQTKRDSHLIPCKKEKRFIRRRYATLYLRRQQWVLASQSQ